MRIGRLMEICDLSIYGFDKAQISFKEKGCMPLLCSHFPTDSIIRIQRTQSYTLIIHLKDVP